MNILIDLIVILAVSSVVLYICARLNLPSIVGFLTAGVLAGPYGIELISTAEEVNIMAEIGILLLLFSIGIEFSLDKLVKSKKYVLIGGALQVGLSIIVFSVGAYLFGLEINQAIFVGMLFAMSSTAIVLQLFQEKGWMNTAFGKSSVSILIFQDIIIIPMMLVTPYLSSSSSDGAGSISKALLGVLLVIAVVFAARKLIPPLLRTVVHTRNQELFLLTIIVICFATAFATQQLGLKLALGAFLAGLIISESEYSYEALKNIMPFKKIFTAIFFVSVGMLLNLRFVVQNFPLLIGLTLVVMVVKLIIIVPIISYLKIGRKNALICGLILCQVGEFAFILSKVGLDTLILSDYTYQLFLAVSIHSMVWSAIIIGYTPKIADRLINLPLLSFILRNQEKDNGSVPKPCGLINHTVIIGFGRTGRRIAKHLAKNGLPISAIEVDERIIEEDDFKLASIIIGNAEDIDVLHRAAVESANQIIITVPQASMAESVTSKTRKLNHNARIIVRSRYANEVEHLEKLGANEVISEEITFAERISLSIVKV